VANLVALCGTGNTGCHGDVEEYRGDARKRLGLHLVERRPDVLEYLSGKLGGHVALVEFLSCSYGGKT
jgi:hypothetical protein